MLLQFTSESWLLHARHDQADIAPPPPPNPQKMAVYEYIYKKKDVTDVSNGQTKGSMTYSRQHLPIVLAIWMHNSQRHQQSQAASGFWSPFSVTWLPHYFNNPLSFSPSFPYILVLPWCNVALFLHRHTKTKKKSWISTDSFSSSHSNNDKRQSLDGFERFKALEKAPPPPSGCGGEIIEEPSLEWDRAKHYRLQHASFR